MADLLKTMNLKMINHIKQTAIMQTNCIYTVLPDKEDRCMILTIKQTHCYFQQFKSQRIPNGF